ncbi:MAG: hypothetical protein KGS72_05050 [Cyanobacteria bacterium REEB67]|nr:hypothetical protein [Cyanobacteria bacterium REEB67]
MLGSLGIDISHAFYARGQLQTAADSAALTGAYYLCTPVPLKVNLVQCEENARLMAARNVVDGTAVVHDGENTIVSVESQPRTLTGPHLCHIHMARNVPTSLARLVGVTNLPVTVDASAGAFMVSKAIMPNWLTNLAVSWRAQQGVLNTDVTDSENNSWMIKEWQGTSSPIVKFGLTPVSAGGSPLTALSPGVLYNVAIVQGGPETGKMPNVSTVIGSTALVIQSFKGPNKAVVKFVPGSLIRSYPGAWPVDRNTNSKDLDFAKNNGQWRVALIR